MPAGPSRSSSGLSEAAYSVWFETPSTKRPEYAEYPTFADDLTRREWDIWAYIDGRDAGSAVEKALHQTDRGFHPYLIVADDTVMPIPTAEIIRQRFGHVEIKGQVAEFGTLVSNSRAKDELGWTPRHSWRDHV